MLDLAVGCVNPHRLMLSCDRGETPLFYEAKVGCHKRFACQCPECSRRWKNKTIVRFKRGIKAMDRPKFMTLTLTKRRSPADNLNRLWDMRKSLFRTLARKGFVITGWLGVVEPPNHVHIVLDCRKFIPQRTISKIWRSVTNDSYIVDIRSALRYRQSQYLSKYLGKSLGDDLTQEEIRGFHVVQSHGVKQLPKRSMRCPVCGLEHKPRLLDIEEYYSQPDRWAEV